MPVDRVRQFRAELSTLAHEAQYPEIDLKQKTPPPLPNSITSSTSWPRISTPVPAARKQKPLVRRPRAPTLTELSSPTAGGTLRPPGAVPPPPRGGSSSLLRNDMDAEPVVDSAEGIGGNGSSSLGHSRRPSAYAAHHSPSTAGMHAVRASMQVPAEPGGESPSGTLSTGAGSTQRDSQGDAHQSQTTFSTAKSEDSHQAESNAQPERWPDLRRSIRRSILFSVLTVATLIASGSWLTLHRPVRFQRSTAKANTPVASGVASKRPLNCSVARSAQRVSPSILVSVVPLANDNHVAGRMVVGFAENATTAAGLTLDPEDLTVSYPFRESKEARVLSVSPLLLDGQPHFTVLRDGQALKQGRAIDAARDFLFGLSSTGFVRQPLGGTFETVWPVDANTNITDPRLSSLPGRVHAVTFRQGGQNGAIMLGWLAEEGLARSGPFQIQSPVGLVGTPTVATSDTRARVAYAGRASETSAWSIYLSQAQIAQPASPAVGFERPDGGPGGDSISPSLASLPDGHWLLQWTEGPSGQRQVRVQTLDPEGHPIGLSHTVSPVGSNSGQGLLWSIGPRAVSLFIVSSGKSSELWAASIICSE